MLADRTRWRLPDSDGTFAPVHERFGREKALTNQHRRKILIRHRGERAIQGIGEENQKSKYRDAGGREYLG